MKLPAGTWIGLLFFASACLEPAEERAERDLRIGHATIESLSVDVVDGLAAVRRLSPTELQLWSSAPVIEIELKGLRAAQSLSILVENCMPDAELTLTHGNASLDALPRAVATECRFRLTPADPDLRLRLAPPDSDTTGAFHIGVLSDVQEAIDDVQDIYRLINREPQLEFILGAGDLTENGSSEQLRRFQSELKQLEIPYYTTLGNHELGTDPPEYHRYFGRGNLSFVFRGVRFSLLDSASATLDPLVYEWLDGWLQQARSGVHVVGMHIPPLDPTGVRNGAFASRNEASKLLGLLAAANVDLTLYGHIHSYYRFYNAGIEAHISGGGGAIPERFDSIGRHFLDVGLNADQGVLGVRVIRVD